MSGQIIRCAHLAGHGMLTVPESLSYSCNACLMQIGEKLGASDFLRYQKMFQFGSKTGIDLRGRPADPLYGRHHERSGTGHQYLRTGLYLHYDSGGSRFLFSDQRGILLSASCGQHGDRQRRHSRRNHGAHPPVPDGSQRKPAILSGKPWEAAWKQGIRGGRQGRRVLYGRKNRNSQKFPREEEKYVVSFIGYAPLDDPEVVVYVVIDEPNAVPQSNSTYAQEVAKEILTALLPYMNLYPDEGENAEAETALPSRALTMKTFRSRGRA